MILKCHSLRTISLEQWSSTVGRQLVPQGTFGNGQRHFWLLTGAIGI